MNYCVIGEAGFGRRYIIEMACKAGKAALHEIEAELIRKSK